MHPHPHAGEAVEGLRRGGAVEHRREGGPRPLSGLGVHHRVAAVQGPLRRHLQGLHGPEQPLRVGLGGGDLLPAHREPEPAQGALPLQHPPEHVRALGGHDGGGHPRPVQGSEQLGRPGEEPGGGGLQLVGRLHEQGPEAGLMLRVIVPGEHGVPVLQGVAHRPAHRLPVRLGPSEGGQPVAVALHDGEGGVPQGVVKIEDHGLIVHKSASRSCEMFSPQHTTKARAIQHR